MEQYFINYGSISQFRQIIKDISYQTYYTGSDEEDNPIYDKSLTLPIITAIGYEKIHGTNAAVCFNNKTDFYIQSRKNIITTEKDNAACAFNATQNQSHWMKIINSLATFHNINLDTHIISIFFEWSGGNIQKLSAVTGLDKRAFIFPYFKISPLVPNEENPEDSIWLSTNSEHNWNASIYNITCYSKFPITINFNEPLLSQNTMIKTIEEDIEPNSPIGDYFGIQGNVGEGLVYFFEYKDTIHRFKVKGEKHSSSKVKTLKPVDDVKEQAKIDFANYACTPDRLEQAWTLIFGINHEIMEPDISQTGSFLRAVITDTMKEESDILASKNLEPKDVNATISKLARQWFMQELDNHIL